jgi:small GTP-binding protein
MLQKKICMVGVFGTGKTCLVQRFVHSIFSPKYLSTVGVKIDRKDVEAGGQSIRLMLWDLEGRDEKYDINPSYLRGSHGLIYVVDGTRRETFDQMFEIRELATRSIGEVPSVVALNKVDLTDEWKLSPDDDGTLAQRGLHSVRTSAKNGQGVEDVFNWLAQAAVSAGRA